MPRVWSTIKSKRSHEAGFSVVEVLLAATVFGALVTAVVGMMVYGRSATARAGDRQRAVLLAEEGIEATRNIGAAAYANLTNGSKGFTQSGSPLVWAFSGTSDTSGIYTRQVAIADDGTNRKSVTGTVTWAQPNGATGSYSMATRLTNWRANIAQWSAGVVGGSANATGTTNAIKVDTQGIYAYTVRNTTTSNFVITNISNPASPSITRTMTIAGTPTNIAVSGDYAYVTNISDTAEVQVIDISDPATASVVRSVNLTGTGNPQDIALSGTRAYVARLADATSGAEEVSTVNISNPLTASEVSPGGFNTTLSINAIYVMATHAYVATSSTSTEIIVLSLSNPDTPTQVATFNASTSVAPLAISGYGTTVILGAGTTMITVNVATPTAPSQADTLAAAGTINDIDVDITQQFAFMGTSSTTGEFQVANVGTPTNTTMARTVDVTGTASTIAGVSYSTSYDVVVGASASDTQEILIFRRG